MISRYLPKIYLSLSHPLLFILLIVFKCFECIQVSHFHLSFSVSRFDSTASQTHSVLSMKWIAIYKCLLWKVSIRKLCVFGEHTKYIRITNKKRIFVVHVSKSISAMTMQTIFTSNNNTCFMLLMSYFLKVDMYSKDRCNSFLHYSLFFYLDSSICFVAQTPPI